MHIGAGIQRPARDGTELQLSFSKRKCLHQCRHFSTVDQALGDVAKQKRFASAASCREDKTGARCFTALAEQLFFDRLLTCREKIFSCEKARCVRKWRKQIVGRHKKGVWVQCWVHCLAGEDLGHFACVCTAQCTLVRIVGIEAVFVNEGEKIQRLSEKTQIMMVGLHLPQNFRFFVRPAQWRFEFDVDNAVVAKAQQIKFFADTFDGIAGKKTV